MTSEISYIGNNFFNDNNEKCFTVKDAFVIIQKALAVKDFPAGKSCGQ